MNLHFLPFPFPNRASSKTWPGFRRAVPPAPLVAGACSKCGVAKRRKCRTSREHNTHSGRRQALVADPVSWYEAGARERAAALVDASRLGVADVLTGLLKDRAFEFPVERAIFAAALHRLFVSGSDRDCAAWMEDSRRRGGSTSRRAASRT